PHVRALGLKHGCGAVRTPVQGAVAWDAGKRPRAPGRRFVKCRTERMLVSHVGSLVRPMSIRNILWARDHGKPYDEIEYEKTLREEVAGVVRKQAEVGVDVVSDGEFGKAGWIRYVAERLGGFAHRQIRPEDREHNPIYMIREAKKFPEFYAAYTPI